MNIKNNEGMSAVLLGISGATQWASKFSKKAVQWVKSKLLGIKSFLSGIKNFLGDAKNKGKKLLNFFKNWFDDDPVGATAGGALVLIVGGIVLLKGAAIGAIGSGGLAAIAKLGSIGGAVAAAAKTATAFAFKNKIISFIGTTIFGGIIANSASFLTNVQFVYNFDWNISVESIRASQQAAMMRVVNQLGETAGMALGGLVCSALPGMAQVEVNPQIFARTWYLVNDDVKEEILDSYADLILAAKNAAKFMAFLETFKNTRDFIRNNVRTGFKGIDDKISKWGLEGKPWILSEKFEEAIESIPNDKVREFTENVLDGFIETCGMIHPQMNVISV
jgi:hypothetical protein